MKGVAKRFAAGGVLAVLLGLAASWLGMPASWGRAIVALLAQASSVLFGIFGVWLGICYHDDIGEWLQGLRGDDLRRRAGEVRLVAERCEILFLGLAVASAVFVFSMFVSALAEPLASLTAGHAQARAVLKAAFFMATSMCVLAQVYSVLAPVAIMAEAMLKVAAARRDAEDMLRRMPPEDAP